MPVWLQHVLVIALAVGCALVFVVRRLRALRSGNPCDSCAHASAHQDRGSVEPAPGRDVPIPPQALIRRARTSQPR